MAINSFKEFLNNPSRKDEERSRDYLNNLINLKIFVNSVNNGERISDDMREVFGFAMFITCHDIIPFDIAYDYMSRFDSTKVLKHLGINFIEFMEMSFYRAISILDFCAILTENELALLEKQSKETEKQHNGIMEYAKGFNLK